MIRVLVSIASFITYAQVSLAAEPPQRAELSPMAPPKTSAVAVPLTADERQTAQAYPGNRMIALEIGANPEVMRVVNTQNLQVFITKANSPKNSNPTDTAEEKGSSKPDYVRITDASRVGGKSIDQYIKAIVDGKTMWLHDTTNQLKGKQRRLVFMGALITNEEFEMRFPLRHVKYTPPSPAEIAERNRATAEAEAKRAASAE